MVSRKSRTKFNSPPKALSKPTYKKRATEVIGNHPILQWLFYEVTKSVIVSSSLKHTGHFEIHAEIGKEEDKQEPQSRQDEDYCGYRAQTPYLSDNKVSDDKRYYTPKDEVEQSEQVNANLTDFSLIVVTESLSEFIIEDIYGNRYSKRANSHKN